MKKPLGVSGSRPWLPFRATSSPLPGWLAPWEAFPGCRVRRRASDPQHRS
jgi:hypothetical protein